jgi:hypothetical protein
MSLATTIGFTHQQWLGPETLLLTGRESGSGTPVEPISTAADPAWRWTLHSRNHGAGPQQRLWTSPQSSGEPTHLGVPAPSFGATKAVACAFLSSETPRNRNGSLRPMAVNKINPQSMLSGRLLESCDHIRRTAQNVVNDARGEARRSRQIIEQAQAAIGRAEKTVRKARQDRSRREKNDGSTKKP